MTYIIHLPYKSDAPPGSKEALAAIAKVRAEQKASTARARFRGDGDNRNRWVKPKGAR